MSELFPVFLSIHGVLALALIGVIMLQPSGSDGLAGGGSTFGGMMTAGGSKTFLSRLTAILATIFIISSLGLTVLLRYGSDGESIVDGITSTPAAPAAEAAPETSSPEPDQPTVPDAQ